MSCTSEVYLFVEPRQTRRWRQSVVVNSIVVFYEAFQEALELRRTAHRKNPFVE